MTHTPTHPPRSISPKASLYIRQDGHMETGDLFIEEIGYIGNVLRIPGASPEKRARAEAMLRRLEAETETAQ